MRYKTFRPLTSVFVLAAVLCLSALPVSAAPRNEAASPAGIEWLAGIWQWLGQLWSDGGAGLGWQSQASTAPAAGTSSAGTSGTTSLKYSESMDRGAALDPNGQR